jgi:hypothetical protein
MRVCRASGGYKAGAIHKFGRCYVAALANACLRRHGGGGAPPTADNSADNSAHLSAGNATNDTALHAHVAHVSASSLIILMSFGMTFR